jgi:hypothetical protein
MPTEAPWRRYLDPSDQWEPRTGTVLVHNGVRHTISTGQGVRGFRYWEQEPTDNIEPCSCGWRPEWGKHYGSLTRRY